MYTKLSAPALTIDNCIGCEMLEDDFMRQSPLVGLQQIFCLQLVIANSARFHGLSVINPFFWHAQIIDNEFLLLRQRDIFWNTHITVKYILYRQFTLIAILYMQQHENGPLPEIITLQLTGEANMQLTFA